MRIIALSGSPAALPALTQLHRDNLLSALICPPETVGAEIAPLEAWAAKQGVPCWQADQNTLENELAELIAESAVNLLLVYGYPFKIPGHLIQQVKYGAWNIHFALQPQNKGSITIHQLADCASTEQVLQQVNVTLMPIETSGSPIHQLSLLSVALLQSSLQVLPPMVAKTKKNNDYRSAFCML